MDRAKLYTDLYNNFLKAFPQSSKQSLQKKCNQFWNSIKSLNAEDFSSKYSEKINLLKDISKRNTSISSFFPQSAVKNNQSQSAHSSHSKQDSSSKDQQNHAEISETVNFEVPTTSSSKQRPCPAEEKLSNELNILNSELESLHARESSDLLSEAQKKEIANKRKRKNEVVKDIKKLVDSRNRQKKLRIERKEGFEQILSENPELRGKLRLKERIGRPAIIEEQPEILNAIVKIAMFGSAAEDRRRMETLNSVKTLDELLVELQKIGFKLSRSALYYHLMPANSRTIDGKKHINTVPVRLIKAQNSMHKNHEDSKFATSTINHLMELASFLGPSDVALLSQDDKCRVPIGITAAKLQAPILMHMQYRVSLPDHDWVVGERHKLIPSVYAGLVINEKGFGDKNAVSYSRPTFIAIRSGNNLLF